MTETEPARDNQSMEMGQDDQMTNNSRNSRRHAWIQKRWKNAVRSVAAIGFKTFEEFLRLSPDEVDDPTSSHELSPLLDNCQQKCHVCREESQPDDQAVQQCQKCQIVVHSNCLNSIPCSSVSKSLSKNKNSGDSANNTKQQQRQRAHTQDDLSNCQDETNNEVDPIYLALKKGNKMANLRKSSLVDCSRGLSQTREITPSAESTVSSSRLAPAQATTNTKTGMSSCSSYTSCASVSSSNAGPRSTPAENVASSSKQVGSAPNLLAQKSIESADEVGPIRKPAAQKTARRAPKLDSKMKSLSLDCADSSNSRKSSITPNLIPNRHALRVPPCKYSSFESDDTAQSSNSGSPCPSSICGSTLTLPSNSYAVTHDYYAKFPEEIDLRVGERVLVVDNSDQDWWQGHNVTGRLGIFPSTCVAHIHCNEQVMQVVQNVCLWVGNKNTRLYRDQIVFAQLDEFVAEGLVTVRTERDHRINCPLQYLMSLE